MLSFRKSFWLLALVVAMSAVASAQLPFQCTANAGVPPIARAEGLAEEVGQVVIICTGGSPTPQGQEIPRVNVQIFLNVNVTSRILQDPWTEALLLIDEPGSLANPAPQLICGSAGTGFDSTIGTCRSIAKAAGNVPGLGNYDGVPSGANGEVGGIDPLQRGEPNVWQARCTGATCATSAPSQIAWLGVPIDPPGSGPARVIRLANVRANANAVLPSGTLVPSTITMLISISGTGSLALSNPNQTVAIVQPGMTFSVVGNPVFQQCTPQTGLCPQLRLRFQENFASSFRVQRSAGQQNIPGSIYNTESMFYNTAFPDLTGSGRGLLGNAGLATQATRLIARFQGVPANVAVWVSRTGIAGVGVTDGNLISADSSGSGGSAVAAGTNLVSCSPGTGISLHQVSLDATGSGFMVWEITSADTGQIGNVDFGVVVRYPDAPLPGLGAATVTGNFAPTSTVNVMSATAAVPRFVNNPQSSATFRIEPCRTNLLWPFVSNQAGFDTGYTIANTSRDPYTLSSEQTGRCTIWYYGAFASEPTRTSFQQTTTSNVEPGTLLAATLSGGGTNGVQSVAGFQGYMIAQCDFQYAHGFGYISPAGAPLSGGATGYVALILDASGLNRTGIVGESLGN